MRELCREGKLEDCTVNHVTWFDMVDGVIGDGVGVGVGVVGDEVAMLVSRHQAVGSNTNDQARVLLYCLLYACI